MNLREFSSENEKFMESLSKGDRQEKDYIRILGIDRDRRGDLIVLRTCELPMAGATERAILSAIASIYDPCGWMSPITLPIKHFLQELWASGTDWNQTLNEEQERQWALIANERKLLNRITTRTLPAFVDEAYAVVVYVTGTQGGQIIFAKNRIAPLKSLTIRLQPPGQSWRGR
ncbi:unnamed protein product [Gongylonema pulchrum]|uniref:Plasmid-related protein n=1 Tax=Gongylonema pulchrum TaxID=637853 RepID=A0A183DUW5_9BILA|nr:unnamed protein product [Gongylonema pulchrum]